MPISIAELLNRGRKTLSTTDATAAGIMPTGIRRGLLPSGTSNGACGAGNQISGLLGSCSDASQVELQYACTGRVDANQRAKLLKSINVMVDQGNVKNPTAEQAAAQKDLLARRTALQAASEWVTVVIHAPADFTDESGMPKHEVFEQTRFFAHEEVVVPLDAVLTSSHLVTNDAVQMEKVQAACIAMQTAGCVCVEGFVSSAATMAGVQKAVDGARSCLRTSNDRTYVVAQAPAPRPTPSLQSGHPLSASESALDSAPPHYVPPVRHSVHGTDAERTDTGLFDAVTGDVFELDGVRRHHGNAQHLGQARLLQLLERHVTSSALRADIPMLLSGIYCDRALFGFLPGFVALLRSALKDECPKNLASYASHSRAKSAGNYDLDGWQSIIDDFAEACMRLLHLTPEARRELLEKAEVDTGMTQDAQDRPEDERALANFVVRYAFRKAKKKLVAAKERAVDLYNVEHKDGGGRRRQRSATPPPRGANTKPRIGGGGVGNTPPNPDSNRSKQLKLKLAEAARLASESAAGGSGAAPSEAGGGASAFSAAAAEAERKKKGNGDKSKE
jgi:hypothetical protein